MVEHDKSGQRRKSGLRRLPALAPMALFFSCGVVGLLALLQMIEPAGQYVDLDETQPPGDQIYTADEPNRLKFAVATMVSAAETFSTYKRLVELVGARIGMEGAIVLRPSYAEVRELLEEGNIDLAFVCTGTYVHSRDRGEIEILAVPHFKGGMTYRCLILVPAAGRAQTFDDLRGTTIAFTDPESNTGFLIPRALLAQRALRADEFFRKIVYTGSHDRSVQAVAAGAVDAAPVNSLVYESMVSRQPSLKEQVRIVWESEPCGPPPVVVPRSLDQALRNRLEATLLSLHEDEEGRVLLDSIGIERFEEPQEAAYESVLALYGQVKHGEPVP